MLPKDTRRVLATLYLMRFFQNAALAVVPPLLPRLSRSLGLSPTQAGGVIGAFGIMRLLTALPLGFYLSRVSRASRLVFAGVGLSFVGTVLIGLAWAYPLVLVGRALVGFGHGMTYLSAQVLFLAFCPPSHMARVFNIAEAVGVGSLVVHGLIGGIVGDRWGWRAAFAYAAASVVVAGGVLVLGTRRLGRRMGEGVPREETPEPSAPPARPGGRAMVYAMILVTAFTLAVAWSGVLTTLIPLYGGNRLRLTSSEIGAVLSAAYLVDIALLFPAGRMMDRYSRTVLLVPALVILMAGVLLLPHTGSFWTYLAVSMFFITGLATWHVPSVLIADLRLGSRQGVALGLVRVVSDVAVSLAPVAIGYLVESAGYGAAAWGVTLLLGGNLAFAGFALARRRP